MIFQKWFACFLPTFVASLFTCFTAPPARWSDGDKKLRHNKSSASRSWFWQCLVDSWRAIANAGELLKTGNFSRAYDDVCWIYMRLSRDNCNGSSLRREYFLFFLLECLQLVTRGLHLKIPFQIGGTGISKLGLKYELGRSLGFPPI